jgi:hypothetical protein
MGALNLRRPESLHRKLSEVAQREGISTKSTHRFCSAEKMFAPMMFNHIRRIGLVSNKKRAAKKTG